MAVRLSEEFFHWPPEQTVFDIDDVEIRLLAGDHPFYLAERDAIAENWTQEVEANPALFNGRMLLQARLGLNEGRLFSEGYEISFSTFLWWRKQAERRGGVHIYAYPVLETSDGALIAIRMGSHTANAGMVYFACGSFEPEDVIGGFCDPNHNMRREVLEETGLDLQDTQVEAGYHVAHFRRAVTLFRVYRFDLTAEEICTRIEAHMQVAEDKEIAGPVVIRSADPQANPYNVGMLPVLDWYFGRRDAHG
ncbi:NUDIX hydrolase [Neorhizobium lilium]|uniref:NUDIX hydrolase n=1 Tax=Neorhizobium lilium TaxID=2503024 RepID=A0A3S3VNJ4_9HYPH|nr:NUDIX hydrolase [Neorhizobium lilium]RWX78412.1 NUDIX hydrolase [Neorhizobium lilium]